jgi:tetratricopeptide (TPR) repeat protein
MSRILRWGLRIFEMTPKTIQGERIMRLKTTLILWVLTAIGCASGKIQVLSSPPQAEVFVGKDGKAPEKLGETPLRLSTEELFSGASEYVHIEIRKDGYNPEGIVVPQAAFGMNVELSVKLKDDMSSLQVNGQAALQKVARGIASAQMQISQRNYDRAETTLNSLLAEFPQISIFHDLLGNVYYLKKDLKRALTSYEEALRLDPENTETERLVRRLRTMMPSDRLPSSGGM